MAVYEDTCGRFYIDGASYFEALYRAMAQAERAIYILGWDINSQLELVRSKKKSTPYPVVLGELLNALAIQRGIQIKILTWDFAPIFTLEREHFSKLKISWRTDKKINFFYDSDHPLPASHHQKLVIIDERMAFCGGLDLTLDRWDTEQHAANNPLRVNPDGKKYPPFHDVQVGVAGKAAKGFADIFRDRWQKATGQRLESMDTDQTVDPSKLFLDNKLDFIGARVGIARTLPAFKTAPAVNEVKQLYLDLITHTKEFLYIENQYFTSAEIARAISSCLQRQSCPEICIVIPKKTHGWFETKILSVQQAKILKQLQENDVHHRLNVFYPEIPDLAAGDYLKVHSKVLIGDDRWARIGSSNLTERSLNLDSECDFVLEATEERVKQSVLKLTSRLLSEHSGLSQSEVEAFIIQKKYRDLISKIRQRESQTDVRRLVTLPAIDKGEPIAIELVDSEVPMALDLFVDENIIKTLGPHKVLFDLGLKRILLIGTLLVFAIAVWRYFPRTGLIDPAWVENEISSLATMRYGAIYSVVFLVLLVLMFVPLNVLILAIATVQDSITAISCIISGVLISAAIGYVLGRRMGADFAKRRWPEAYKKLEKTFITQRVLSIIIVRLIPIAPFNVVNILSGTIRVHFVRYMIGTFVGVLPGTLALVFFQKNLMSVVLNPSLEHLLSFLLALVGLIMIFRFAKKRLTR